MMTKALARRVESQLLPARAYTGFLFR